MPQIIPIRDLKDATRVVQLCKESDEPVYVTRNGYGELVLMSMAVYERIALERDVAAKLAEAREPGTKTYDIKEVFGSLREKYAP